MLGKKLLCVAISGLAASLAAPARADLTLSAPPRESAQAAQALYGPLADYLGKVLGQKVTYSYSDNWAVYQSLMQKDKYDLVFDGAHFVSWRMEQRGHQPLVAQAGNQVFVVAVRSANTAIQGVDGLVAKRVCAHAPPNFATLTFLGQFDKPARQPQLVETTGFRGAYDGLMGGRCDAAVMPAAAFKAFNDKTKEARLIFESRAFPNQALTASARVSSELKDRISKALLSEQGRGATRKLVEEFGGKDFVVADPAAYAGLSMVLNSTFGFAPGK